MDDSESLIQKRIENLRNAMKNNQISAYIALTSDPHISEYLPEFWQIRKWLSGFTGSVATLVVTANFAGLWVDSRYWKQAENQLKNTGISVQKMTNSSNSFLAWLEQNLPEKSVIAIDGTALSISLYRELEQKLSPKNIQLDLNWDILSYLWNDRPNLPESTIFEHKPPFTMQSRTEKLNKIREKMNEKHADFHLISSLDDIAWLTNLRGSDVSYNPVFLAYLLINKNEAILFVNNNRISNEIQTNLKKDGFSLQNYENLLPYLQTLNSGSSLLIDPKRTTICVKNVLSNSIKIIEDLNPSTLLKACKTKEEIENTRRAMEHDGVALCEFFVWLENAIETNQTLSELTIEEKLLEFRQKNPEFVSESFSTIAAFNENAALPHYRATKENHKIIENEGLLLIDSGAQYLCGTTDITRVIPIRKVSREQKRDYTLVLKSNIALSSIQFPNEIPGQLIDSIARNEVWKYGLDYGHGTGHGVGYFLNVHEGPQVLSYHALINKNSAMKIGMITSIEPGLYRQNQWGIRIENLVVNQPSQKTEFGDFLHFEVLTLCPIDTTCIDFDLMTNEDITWLNHYHKTVFERLSTQLSPQTKDWLAKKTKPIDLH